MKSAVIASAPRPVRSGRSGWITVLLLAALLIGSGTAMAIKHGGHDLKGKGHGGAMHGDGGQGKRGGHTGTMRDGQPVKGIFPAAKVMVLLETPHFRARVRFRHSPKAGPVHVSIQLTTPQGTPITGASVRLNLNMPMMRMGDE